MRRIVMWAATFALAVAASAAVRADETCPEQVSREVAEMRKLQAALRSGPYENGPIQELGKCTQRALKHGLTMAVRGPASAAQAAREEAANCLALKIEVVSARCYCRQLGHDLEQGLDMDGLASRMEEVDDAYDKATKAADIALNPSSGVSKAKDYALDQAAPGAKDFGLGKLGPSGKDLGLDKARPIPNQQINEYVKAAEQYRRCYDKLALNALKEITDKLDAIAIAENVPPNSSPMVNVPAPGTNTAAVNTPKPGTNGATVHTPTPNVPGTPTVNTPPPGANVATANASTPAVPLASGSPPAGNCTDLRNDIAAMDAQSNAMPGYMGMRNQLASLYNKLCGTSAQQRTEYWYTSDGKQLGPVGAGDRPPNAAYSATQDIGDQCAGTANPSMCALAAGAVANCKSPPLDLSGACSVAGGYGDPDETVAATGGDPLPDAKLTVGGTTYDVPSQCARALARAGDGRPSAAALRACPEDLLAALAKAEGKDFNLDPTAFLGALGPLMNKGFVPAGTAPKGGFDSAFCAQAQRNADICKQRETNMGTAGQAIGQGTTGQVGAFDDCYRLYSRFAGMCRMNVNMRPQIQKASLPKPAAPPAPPPQPKPAAPAAAAQPQMSPQCQQLVSNYVSAAQANNGPGAVAGYNALKSAGGCGVLAKFDRPPPAVPAPADDLPSRGATPLSDQVIGGCAQASDGCAAQVRQLQAGVSPEAQAAVVMNAIQIGLQLGSAMASGIAAAQPQGGGGGGPHMNSIGNRPVRGTYGQGAPAYQPRPSSGGSDITGIGTH
jgi:hypothetical protein